MQIEDANKELKSCPYCGKKPEIVCLYGWHYISCFMCVQFGLSIDHEGIAGCEYEAIEPLVESWNTRAGNTWKKLSEEVPADGQLVIVTDDIERFNDPTLLTTHVFRSWNALHYALFESEFDKYYWLAIPPTPKGE